MKRTPQSRRPLLAAAWLTLVATSGALAAPPARAGDRPLARVGGETITAAQVVSLVQGRFGDGRFDDGDGIPRPLKSAALLGLVRRQLALARLLEIGGEPLRARITRRQDQQLAALRRSDPGATLPPELAADIAWKVAWNEYIGRQMTEENLARFYDAHRWRYDGTRVSVSQIFVPHGDASTDPASMLGEVARQIDAGELSFADAARAHSQAMSAADGGRIGWVTGDGDLPPPVAEEVLRAEPRTLVGPVRSPLGWHLLWVDQRESGTVPFASFADRASLRRDAANFLFARLVRSAAQSVEVHWLVDTLRPPTEVTLAPRE